MRASESLEQILQRILMPHFLYTGASTAVTLNSGDSVQLTKNSGVTLPSENEWVRRHVAIGSLVELPKEEPKTKPVAAKTTSKKEGK